MFIRMIGKLEEDKKAHWSRYLPELLLAYNATCSAVMGYSAHFLHFGWRLRILVDCQFPTIRDLPHTTKPKQSVAEVQKRLKSAFKVMRHLTSEEAVRQQCYYDHSEQRCCPTTWGCGHGPHRPVHGQVQGEGSVA